MKSKIINNIICDDSNDVFKKLKKLNIKLVLTSPSYYSQNLLRNKLNKEIGLENSKEEYVKTLKNLFKNIYKNMSKESIIVMIIGTYNNLQVRSLIYLLENEFNKINLKLKSFKEFNKNNSEAILVFQKGEQKYDFNIPNFLNIQIYTSIGFGQIDNNVLSWAINSFSNINDLVVDPFAGEGSTLINSKKLNRKFFGIDINYNSVEKAKKNI